MESTSVADLSFFNLEPSGLLIEDGRIVRPHRNRPARFACFDRGIPDRCRS